MTDPYDLKHFETGSGNISRATPEWQEILTHARRIRSESHSDEYVLHIAYRLVNEQCELGTFWSKCRGCGSPYRLDNGMSSSEHCSLECEEEESHD